MGWLDYATKESYEAVTLDDLPSASRVIARLLRRIGFSVVHETDSAEQAFRAINNHNKVRALICDSALPNDEGYSLLSRLGFITATSNS
jgi:CheY-like chemotaxis protein